MKVAFFSVFILEYGGGLEKYLIEMSRQLSQINGIEADVITMDDDFVNKYVPLYQLTQRSTHKTKSSMYKESEKSIKKRLGKASYFKVNSIKELKERLKRYDVIYCKNEFLEAFIIKLLLGYRNLPPVIFGGHTPLRYPVANTFHAKLRNFIYGSYLYRFLASGVRRFHVLNNYELMYYQKLFPKIPVMKIYNPFDIQEFSSRARQGQSKQDNTDAEINIMWAGRLTPQKGVHELSVIIQRVNALMTANQRSKISWNIYGDGELRPIVETLEKQESNVKYYGHVEQDSMPSTYKQHQVLVSTSQSEGYPYNLIEPQAFGLQIFAFAIPGVSDITRAYEGGRLSNSIDAFVEEVAVNLCTWLKANRVPISKPSKQFEPSAIYPQIINLLRLGASDANTNC
jgi:glycosyltransferase involved in cell wall biosynthesis